MQIFQRLREPSTYAGIAAAIALFSPNLSEAVPPIGAGIIAAIGAVCAVLAVFGEERLR